MLKEGFQQFEIVFEQLVDQLCYVLAAHGQALEHLRAGASRTQPVELAMRVGRGHVYRLGGDVVVVIGFLNSQHPVLKEVQDIDGHGQARRMYSKR